MSYLDLPRISFLGTFFTDPSTVNNDPSHYDPDVTRPSPWQDPKGMHQFKFTEARVQGAIDANGKAVVGGDPLISATVVSTDDPAPAKIADLDVYQQSVPTIFGMSLRITLSGGATLTGAMDPCALNSLRFSRVLPTRGWQPWDSYPEASFGGDTYACGSYQSVLRVDPADWPATGISALLDQLHSSTITDADGKILVSIRWVPDSYQNVPWEDRFDTGRVVGTLGPVLDAKEPLHAPGVRWANPRPLETDDKHNVTAPWYWPDFWGAPFKVADRGGQKTVVIDLANAMSMEDVWGKPVPLGDLTAQFGDGSTGSVGPFMADENLYAALGGIIEMPLDAAQQAASGQPMSIVTSRQDIGGPALWSEAPGGRYWQVENRVFRMTSEPDSSTRTASGKVLVTQWGQPAPGVQLGVEVVSVVNGIKGATVPWVAGYEGNTNQAEGALKASIGPSDADGYATFQLEVVTDPGARTPELDGQLYFVMVYDPQQGPAPDLTKVGPVQEQQISVIAWSSYAINSQPAWEEIKALMDPYVKLYPGMSDRIKLNDEHSFQIFGTNPPWAAPPPPHEPLFHPPTPITLPDGSVLKQGSIGYMMSRDVNDPRFMPVTRDMSPNRITTVLYYCYNLSKKADGNS